MHLSESALAVLALGHKPNQPTLHPSHRHMLMSHPPQQLITQVEVSRQVQLAFSCFSQQPQVLGAVEAQQLQPPHACQVGAAAVNTAQQGLAAACTLGS